MSSDAALIDIRGLTKAYGYRPVLKKLDLTVQRGEFVALLGPNGSGKSTLLRLLCGLSKPTAGKITVGGWSLPQEAAAVRAQIGMVGHKSLLYEALTAQENLRFFARLYNLNVTDADIDTQIERVGLKKYAAQPVKTYSRGMQQRLSIARALLHDPAVLLFDEPYTGLDQDAATLLDGLLQTAHADERTILMTTHQIERAANLASRVVILSRGVIAYESATADIPSGALPLIYADATDMVTAR
ncbi:MAG: heme ABC exporter ATP-binding protein CcmA [Chloroflexota bacterium]